MAKLTIRVALKDDFTKSMGKIRRFIGGEMGVIGKSFKTATRSVFNLRNALAGGLVAYVGKDLVDAFATQEKSVAQFTDALRRGGKAGQDYADDMVELAGSLQKVGVFGDEAILSASKLLAQTAAIGKDALPRAIKLSTDLAAALGMDLNTAARLVTNAAVGMTSTFTRYGIKIDEQIAKSGDFNAIMGELEKTVGGANQALAATTSGQLAQLGNLWGDVKEQFGAFIAEVMKSGLGQWVKAVFTTLNRELGEMTKNLKGTSPTARAFADTVIGAFEGIAISAAAVADGIDLLIRGFSKIKGLSSDVEAIQIQSVISEIEEELEKANDATAIYSFTLKKAMPQFNATADMLVKQALGTEMSRKQFIKLRDDLSLVLQSEAAARQAAKEHDAQRRNQGTNLQRVRDFLKDIRIQLENTRRAEEGFGKTGDSPMYGVADPAKLKKALKGQGAIVLQGRIETLDEIRAREKEMQEASKSEWRRYFESINVSAQAWKAEIVAMTADVAGGVANIVGDALDQVLQGEITSTKELGKALTKMFTDLARQILVDMVKITVQMAIMSAFKTTLGASFAQGGILRGGLEPMPRAANGGVFTGPQPVLLGDNPSRVEAAVPLPDGRRIPVDLRGGEGGDGTTVNLHIQAIDGPSLEASLARPEALRAITGAVVDAKRSNSRFRQAMGS